MPGSALRWGPASITYFVGYKSLFCVELLHLNTLQECVASMLSMIFTLQAIAGLGLQSTESTYPQNDLTALSRY